MGRQAPAEVAEDAHAVDVLDPLDEDDVGALGNGEVDREVGGLGNLAHCGKRGMPQLVAGERELPELVEVDAEAVVAVVWSCSTKPRETSVWSSRCAVDLATPSLRAMSETPSSPSTAKHSSTSRADPTDLSPEPVSWTATGFRGVVAHHACSTIVIDRPLLDGMP